MPRLKPPDLHLYVHIPFCAHKCHYCDFNSHVRNTPPWKNYQDALLAELDYWAAQPQFQQRTLTTVFFGGGTPSLAPPALIAAVLDKAVSVFAVETNAEITLEANPGTVDEEHFSGYKAAGVNRLSIGVQSFDDTELKWLERIHNSAEAIHAYEIARKTGFDNVNLDLMYALPDQPLQHWQQRLDTAIRLDPEHLSCYQLTIEPHTRLAADHAASPYLLPDQEVALAFFTATRELLGNHSYAAYEVSNFARAGKHCRHNDGYWLYHDYLGIGAGASGKWDTPDGGIYRYSNNRSPETYIHKAVTDGTAIHSNENLDTQRAAAEAVWLGLRRIDGISRENFTRRFGADVWPMFESPLRQWRNTEHVQLEETRLLLTPKGLPLADGIAASVL
ncbi:MAG: radical SAM family heme chaperone HemW [Mariprofundaceae bacterium]